jgi:16S rRNA (cytidine1402-2'-O)-methyltransferase
MPSKEKARNDVIDELANVNSTLVFYESGPRLAKTLAALASKLGQRDAAIGRELTKKFEEVVTGNLQELSARYAETEPKGEIVLIVGPPEKQAAEIGDVDVALMEALERLPASKAASEVAKRFGLDRKELYARAAKLKR